MAEKITQFNQAAIDTINRQLETFDLHQKQLANLKSTVGELQGKVLDLQNQKQTVGSNNLVVTWTGGSTTLSWVPAYVRDRNATNYPIAAGSAVVAPSAYYWLAWNPKNSTMSVNSNLTTLTNLPNLIVICQVFAGSGGQSGSAGGGGTDPGGTGPNGKEYKNF